MRKEDISIVSFPGGMSFADRTREEHGDYKRLGFIPWDTLEPSIKPDCPPVARELITTTATELQARSGESYTISACGQSVRLGCLRPVEFVADEYDGEQHVGHFTGEWSDTVDLFLRAKYEPYGVDMERTPHRVTYRLDAALRADIEPSRLGWIEFNLRQEQRRLYRLWTKETDK